MESIITKMDENGKWIFPVCEAVWFSVCIISLHSQSGLWRLVSSFFRSGSGESHTASKHAVDVESHLTGYCLNPQTYSLNMTHRYLEIQKNIGFHRNRLDSNPTNQAQFKCNFYFLCHAKRLRKVNHCL